jgi:hypothetical protein
MAEKKIPLLSVPQEGNPVLRRMIVSLIYFTERTVQSDHHHRHPEQVPSSDANGPSRADHGDVASASLTPICPALGS